jgi:hypothetical protein
MKPICISGTERKYLKDKISSLAVNSKNKNIRDLYRGINEFKQVKVLLFSVTECLYVSDVRQIEVHAAEPFAHGTSHLEVETAIAQS